MRITNIRRKLAAALVAGGLFAPVASPAADLNTNLITDGGFENIDEFDVGQFQSVRLLDWPDSDVDFDFLDDNFAYAYSLNYAGSNPSPEAGLYHFTGGFNTTAGDAQILQSIDISTGETGALVPTGSAFYRLSGYFTSYRSEDNASGLRARFFGSNNTELGVVEIGGLEFVQSLPISNVPIAGQRDWGLDTGVGLIPAGTRTVQIEVFADATTETNDGYVDLVDFRVGETNEFVLNLTVDRASGALTLTNSTLESVSISEYSITSALGALDPAGWLSIAENYDANSGGTVDASSNWSELSSPDDHTALTEADTVLAPGAAIAPGQTVVLSQAGGWIKSPTEDVGFAYTTGGTVVPGTIRFVGNNDEPFSQGDLDFDNDLDLADWTLFRQNQHVDLTVLSPAEAYQRGDLNGDLANNHADFVQFKRLFNAANGAGALEAALSGVPEPTTWLLFIFAARRCFASNESQLAQHPWSCIDENHQHSEKAGRGPRGRGSVAPAASPAADLNTNLITDPSFENIDEFDVGPFQSVRLLDWPDSELDGDFLDDNFAYAYSLNYAGSNPSPEAGLYHFTGGFNTTAGDALIQQSIDISTGETGSLVPTGSAFYRLSGYFTAYRDQADASGLRARFFGSNSTELGVAEIGGLEFVQSLPISNVPIANQRDWGLDTGFGPIPAGTRTVQIEVFSDDTDVNTDGYVDLVDFRVGNVGDFVLVLQVNTAAGEATLSNNTGSPVEIDYYEISSTGGALNVSGWNSLQDQDFAGTGGGATEGDYNASGQVEQADLDLVLLNWGQDTPPVPSGWTNDLPTDLIDQAELDGVLLNWGNMGGGAGPGEGWEEAGGGDAGVLSESFLLGASTLDDGAEVDLGMFYNAAIGGEDLVFRYGLESGALVTGFVQYMAAGGAAAVPEPASVCLIVGCAALAGGLVRKRGEVN